MNRFILALAAGLISCSFALAQEPTPNSEREEKIDRVKSSGAVKVEKKPAVPVEALKQADKEEAKKNEMTTSENPVATESSKKKSVEETPVAPGSGDSSSHLFGVHAALGVPHPLSYGLNYVHSSHFFSAELSTGAFGLTASDVKVKMNNTELALRWHPFAGSFYLGAIYGNQKITAEKTEVITVATVPQTVNAKVEVKSNYLSPHFGWMWGNTASGFFASMEFGYQSPSGVTTDFSTDANALAQAQPEYATLEKDVKKQGNDIGNMGLPHIVLLKIGWLF